MQYHLTSDPYRPFQHFIAEIMQVALPPNATIEQANAVVPASLSVLYSAFTHSEPPQAPKTTFMSFLARIKDLDASSPEPDDLVHAPKLFGWALARHPTSLCSAIGYGTGHPDFRFGSPIVTSVVCRIDHDHRWVRTWNRFYQLEEYEAATLEKLKAAGMLKSDVKLGTLSDASGSL